MTMLICDGIQWNKYSDQRQYQNGETNERTPAVAPSSNTLNTGLIFLYSALECLIRLLKLWCSRQHSPHGVISN